MFWFWKYWRDTYHARQKFVRKALLAMAAIMVCRFLLNPDPIGIQLHDLWIFHSWFWSNMYVSYVQPWIPEISFERKVLLSSTVVSTALSTIAWHWLCARRKRRLQNTP